MIKISPDLGMFLCSDCIKVPLSTESYASMVSVGCFSGLGSQSHEMNQTVPSHFTPSAVAIPVMIRTKQMVTLVQEILYNHLCVQQNVLINSFKCLIFLGGMNINVAYCLLVRGFLTQ